VELGLESISNTQLPQALDYFRQAAARSPAAAANAALLESRMRQIAKNASQPQPRTAEEWFLDARRYHRGEGVPSNYAEAIRLYQIAAASGSKEAKRMLERIYSRPAPQGTIDIAWMQQLAQLDITPEGAILSAHAPSGQPLFGRDPTPLYDLLPNRWRGTVQDRRH
jgi:TPR repeat protein